MAPALPVKTPVHVCPLPLQLLEALQQQERNQMTVAYYLILDHKRRKILGASPVMHPAAVHAAHIPSHAVQPHEIGSATQTAEDLSVWGPLATSPAWGSPAVPTVQLQPANHQAVQRSVEESVQRRWHLGVQR